MRLPSANLLQRSSSLAVSLLLALTSVGVFAQSSSAHDVLVATDPVIGSTETSIPEAVKLTFNDKILTGLGNANQVVVKDPMGMIISSGPAHVSGAVMSEVLSPTMIAYGKYTVIFRVVSADGHPVSGSFSFFVNSKPKAAPGVTVPTSGQVTLTASIRGSSVPNAAGQPGAIANAWFRIDFATKTLCYFVSAKSIAGVTAIHVHPRNMKNLLPSDLISIPVNKKALTANKSKPYCQSQDRATMANLAAHPERFVVMLHSVKFPEGAALGVFKK